MTKLEVMEGFLAASGLRVEGDQVVDKDGEPAEIVTAWEVAEIMDDVREVCEGVHRLSQAPSYDRPAFRRHNLSLVARFQEVQQGRHGRVRMLVTEPMVRKALSRLNGVDTVRVQVPFYRHG